MRDSFEGRISQFGNAERRYTDEEWPFASVIKSLARRAFGEKGQTDWKRYSRDAVQICVRTRRGSPTPRCWNKHPLRFSLPQLSQAPLITRTLVRRSFTLFLALSSSPHPFWLCRDDGFLPAPSPEVVSIPDVVECELRLGRVEPRTPARVRFPRHEYRLVVHSQARLATAGCTPRLGCIRTRIPFRHVERARTDPSAHGRTGEVPQAGPEISCFLSSRTVFPR